MIRRIEPGQVQLGMYVRSIGGPWFRHSFWRKRFRLETQADVDRLRTAGVPYIEIDVALGHDPGGAARTGASAAPDRSDGVWCGQRPSLMSALAALPPAVDTTAQRGRQIGAAVRHGKAVVQALFASVEHGRPLPLAEAMLVVDELRVILCVGAKALLDTLRDKEGDDYAHLHSVAVCALMMNFARQLGMPEPTVRDYGLAGLVHDVGKIRVPEALLTKPGRLTPEEYELVKTHAEEGYTVLAAVSGIPPAALDVARHHHEKLDGSGYPAGLTGGEISLVARMGAICDIYDALTSNRPYKRAWPVAQVLAEMGQWEGHLDRDLLQCFSASLGLDCDSLPVTTAA